MFYKRRTILYFVPHQDDELLSMGIDICCSLMQGHNVHVILCSDGSQSYVKKLLCNQKSCPKHEGTHCYELSTEEFIAARDKEFFESCSCLGIPEKNIHIPQVRSIDGSLEVSFAEKLIKDYVRFNAIICTIHPNTGPSQHRDHKALGQAAENLLNAGTIKQVRYFIEPYQYDEFVNNPEQSSPPLNKIIAQEEVSDKVKKAIGAYSRWSPEHKRYAVGYHSVASEFNDFLSELTCHYLDKQRPQKRTWLNRLIKNRR